MTGPGLREQILLKETEKAGEKRKSMDNSTSETVVMDPKKSTGPEQYFTAYDDVSVHRLMVRDAARTEAYRRAVLENAHLFKDKVVMDVGAGTGVLSLFAKQAGAKKVYAVEASGMTAVLREIIELNDEEGVIEVVEGRAEEVDIGNVKVDIMISEWMGFYLLHESMLDSVILAREKHLDEDGIMFPSHASIYAAPVKMDEWVQEEFTDWSDVYGFNMTPMAQKAMESRLGSGQPEVTCLAPDSLLAEPVSVLDLDLRWVQREEVQKVEDRKFVSVTKEGRLHGLALWFDATFNPMVYDEDEAAKIQKVVLGTGPRDVPTHWKQTVLLLLGDGGQTLEEDEVVGWQLGMEQSAANPRQYSLSLELLDPATEEHPVPCICRMGKCALIKALLDKEEEEMEDMQELPPQLV